MGYISENEINRSMRAFAVILLGIALSNCSKSDRTGSGADKAAAVERLDPDLQRFELITSRYGIRVVIPPVFASGLSAELSAALKDRGKWIHDDSFQYQPVYGTINTPIGQVVVSQNFLIINENDKWVKLEGPYAAAIALSVREMPTGKLKQDANLDEIRTQLTEKMSSFKVER